MDKVKLLFLNAWFFALFLISSAVVIPVLTVLVAFWRIFHSQRSTMRRFRRAISLYGRVVTLLPYPAIKVRYEHHEENGPPEPYIFVANHRSASDAFLMCVLPHEAVQVVNTWPFRIPVLGLYAKWSGYLNVKNMLHEEFFHRAGKLLREGVCMIFFPEGTRSGSRTMGNFHGSAFRLALQEKATIVPLCISGNENIPRKGTLMLQPGTIRVRRLPAIPFEEFKDLSAFALKNRVREIIQTELNAMEGAA
jgi:1-acyl-sn-glycerol-3-phosphate acyltransferase